VHKSEFTYSEDILQWIWKSLLFDTSQLKTIQGKPITIFDPGVLNVSDGPDFLNAKLLIDGIIWFGAIELHLESRGWKQHGHHLDNAYNKVILHVVVEDTPKKVRTANGEVLPTLNLLPYLPELLSSFVSKFDKTQDLPCSNGLTFISKDAFLAQMERAHSEYLEKKANDFLSFYNPELMPSTAWKHALILSLFDGFGIAHNRQSMQKLGEWFLNQTTKPIASLIEDALEFAGFGASDSELDWNYKGVFPVNHPQVKIPQAIEIALTILRTPFDFFLEPIVFKQWKEWMLEVSLEGSGKMKILYGTVYLPAIYVLGNLFGAKELSNQASKEWNNLKVPIPKSILKSYSSLPEIPPAIYNKKLGSIHQLKAYCNTRRCHECFVLKKVILS
tara:strand:+ start:2924 stop:4090 length:1167 start_codon:yes stop_codon:yes gene_type:complete